MAVHTFKGIPDRCSIGALPARVGPALQGLAETGGIAELNALLVADHAAFFAALDGDDFLGTLWLVDSPEEAARRGVTTAPVWGRARAFVGELCLLEALLWTARPAEHFALGIRAFLKTPDTSGSGKSRKRRLTSALVQRLWRTSLRAAVSPLLTLCSIMLSQFVPRTALESGLKATLAKIPPGERIRKRQLRAVLDNYELCTEMLGVTPFEYTISWKVKLFEQYFLRIFTPDELKPHLGTYRAAPLAALACTSLRSLGFLLEHSPAAARGAVAFLRENPFRVLAVSDIHRSSRANYLPTLERALSAGFPSHGVFFHAHINNNEAVLSALARHRPEMPAAEFEDAVRFAGPAAAGSLARSIRHFDAWALALAVERPQKVRAPGSDSDPLMSLFAKLLAARRATAVRRIHLALVDAYYRPGSEGYKIARDRFSALSYTRFQGEPAH